MLVAGSDLGTGWTAEVADGPRSSSFLAGRFLIPDILLRRFLVGILERITFSHIHPIRPFKNGTVVLLGSFEGETSDYFKRRFPADLNLI